METSRGVRFESHTGDPEKDLAYERERRRVVDEDGVPTEVADYLDYFAQMIEKKDVPEIHNLYEQHFPDLTERLPLPENRLFIILYKELYYRQVYARNQRGPSLSHRFESFMNYQDLFSEILSSKEPVSLSLPNVWLWDIIDEFVYQFQAFCLYKANPGKRSVDEVDELISIEEAQNAWNIYPVLNILYSLLSKSQINEQLAAIKARRNPDEVADEFGQSALYFKLGYFSLIGLLRTHVLLGDYHQALKTVANVELDAKIGKTYEQLFHLLAICLAIQPQRIDEAIASQLSERCGDRISRMTNGDLDEFRLAFQMGCPKFLSPTTVVYEGSNLSKEPLLRQSQAFLEGVEAQMALPVLRGYLKLYTSLPTKKLASFMDVDDASYDSFLGKLLTYKMVVNELGKDSVATPNDDDEPNTDIDFYVDKDMICIADTKVARRVGEHFIRHMQKLHEVQKMLKKLEVKP
ncbi:hypothetical protein ANCCAN_23564 [Ancylostoma caninum]|uniref:Eukaryotic translation initiation factor 3 subunit L n=1 Tax=Ancylostoma caninum TaxID=29170 RepID=A0A368FIM5_ANCCA|nr:hypothetical protein ANCCAN_23564 [Ancylostoma caninum]